MTTSHPIRFVSLGPGEPDLITLKGFKVLQTANRILCPVTMTRDGESSSWALSILDTLGFSDTVRYLRLPMDKNQVQALKVYEAVYESSKTFRAEGRNVVIVAEGDTGFYSSIHHIYDKLQEDGIPVEQIVDVLTFAASGTMTGMHIVNREERLIILPGLVIIKGLEDYLEQRIVTVIMKLSQCVGEICQCINSYPEYQYHYFKNIGAEEEYYSCFNEGLREERFPYFSVMVIRF